MSLVRFRDEPNFLCLFSDLILEFVFWLARKSKPFGLIFYAICAYFTCKPHFIRQQLKYRSNRSASWILKTRKLSTSFQKIKDFLSFRKFSRTDALTSLRAIQNPLLPSQKCSNTFVFLRQSETSQIFYA